MSATQFTTVLPHEPLPGGGGGGDDGPRPGHVHLQGAFVPRRKAAGPSPDGPSANNGHTGDGGKCPCHDPACIETTLRRSLHQIFPRWGMDPDALVSVAAVRDPPNSPRNEGAARGTAGGVSKVRLTLASAAAARTFASRVRRAQYSPRDAFASQNGVVVNEGLCPHGCGARYSGKELQATHVTPIDDRTAATSGATASNGHSKETEGEGDEATRWARAAPPKFRRLQATDNAATAASRHRLTEEEAERRRKRTRFVYVGNVLANVTVGDVALCDEDGRAAGDEATSQEASPEARDLKERLVSIFRGRAWDDNDGGGDVDEVDAVDRGMAEDDVRHAFHEAFRASMASDDPRGVELFTKNDKSGGKGKRAKAKHQHRANHVAGTRNLYDSLHIGTRSNAEAARAIQTWQGRRIQLAMDLPRSMAPHHGAAAGHNRVAVVVATGPLFLDYADVLLPHERRKSTVPVPQGECTSATAHVTVPGLHLLPNYISEKEERVLLAAATGPHAPWAPPQRTPSGGRIQRRVQHYGYVFDYASADVLRRNDDDSEEGRVRAACPPLPALGPSRTEVAELTDGEVETRIARAVEDVRGWEALAGVVERTRRVDLASYTKQGNEARRTHPHLNQMTVNEYAPGQGIGSHVDTETAFDDGLLIITLGGGIVMEFRKVDDPTGTKKLLYLPPRSLVLLSGDARYRWEHMIVSRMTDTVDGAVLPRKLRVSLTLRTALTAPRPGEEATPLPLYESSAFPPRWGQPSEAAARNTESSMDESTTDLVTPECEARHVHDVYDAIATQWHHTRGRRGVLWPGATRFLEDLPPGSVVADVGCGDGKYFAAIWASQSYVIGTDISEPLLQTARAAGGEGAAENGADGPQYQRLSERKRTLGAHPAVAVADCIHLPLRTDSCDAAICIAVMHHLSTVGRRLRCLAELRRVVKVGGLVNVQAWALEQEDDSKRKFHGTDLLVPFNAQPKYLQNGSDGKSTSDRPGEETEGKGVAQMMAELYEGAEYDSKKNLVVFQRYCHMYRRGELEGLCEQVPGLEVLESSYEKGNHGVLLRVCNY